MRGRAPALHDEQAGVLLAGLQPLLPHILLLPIRLVVIIVLVSINVPAGRGGNRDAGEKVRERSTPEASTSTAADRDTHVG